MKPRDYCCCAIPTVNAGIYTILVEQLVLGILVGTLALATPSIVGAATPSFAPWLLAIVAYCAAGIQFLGFIGVSKEKSITYRRYVTLHVMLTVATFSIAAVWIAVSASRHSTANSKCQTEFFPSAPGTAVSSEGQTLCDVVAWVDVGLMGGLWLFLAIVQFYFYIVISSYGTAQRRDHERYDSAYDAVKPLNSDIPMTNRDDTWQPRPSTDSDRGEAGGYGHVRQDSLATVMGEPLQETSDDYKTGAYHVYGQGGYPPQRQTSKAGTLTHPANAYTQEPGPTPTYSDSYYTGTSGYVDKPQQSQMHPGES